ncbi:zinc finger SWIM domain-containing protein 7 isoform X2 [Vigna unguiculata]|nr:zinc finger SWIM domain-containing protein 7 isoform X2 [Vigna unguiculata]XP_027937031.1 zinc finger SWIM domain-containing protein 7 isoform X2 [Vigna unguiculata]XP_027937040.1 zinc finger SWIM domain-containing protein 7 isoform X2 [Vigna unguiculata]
MSASCLVAETVWKDIESTHKVNDDQLWTLVNCFPFLCVLFKSLLPRIVFLLKLFLVFMQHETSLHFLFGKNFEGATRIVDQRGVSKISAHPSGRFIFQVRGESRRKEQYLCFAENFCACYSFFYDVVNRREQLCCKHQLAARLAASLGSYAEVKVSDEELALLLSTI